MNDTKYRALVADLDSRARAQLTDALTDARFLVTEARDARDLSEIIRVAPIDHFRLVIVHHAMPGLRELSELAGTRKPVMIVTGPDHPTLFHAAHAIGALAHVTSPLDVAELLETVDDLVFGKTVPARPKFVDTRS